MKKTGFAVTALGLCLLLTACGGKSSYTDYTGYLNGALSTSQPVLYDRTTPEPITPNSDFANIVTIISSPAPVVSASPAPAASTAQGSYQQPSESTSLTTGNIPADSFVTYNSASQPVPSATVSTPQPTHSPSPTPYVPMVQITKSPTSETVQEGGSALFIARAENYDRLVWITVSPDKRTSYEIGDAPAHFPGLVVDGQGMNDLRLSNIPYSMNGWRIQAYFTGNGGPVYTSGAYLTVVRESPVGPVSFPTATPGADVQALVESLAKQAYSDAYYRATADGFTTGPISNYSYTNGLADFNVTFSNRLFTVTAEFNACYYSSSSYAAGPIYAAVYDPFGSLLASQRMTGASMNELYIFLDAYKQ